MTIPTKIWRFPGIQLIFWNLIALIACISFLSTSAVADSMVSLPTIERTATIEGQSFTIPIHPEVSFGDGILKLKVTLSLAGFQQKSSLILQALAARKSRCETRWSFPELATPAVSGGRLRISGKFRAELRLCGLIKTKLGRDTADFTLAVFPTMLPDQISVRAELERFDLGRSLLADLGLEDELRKTIETELNRALSGGANLAFPAEIAALGPRFTGIELVDKDGTAQIAATSEAAADPATLLKLVRLFHNQ